MKTLVWLITALLVWGLAAWLSAWLDKVPAKPKQPLTMGDVLAIMVGIAVAFVLWGPR
jgi:hypothetical protein